MKRFTPEMLFDGSLYFPPIGKKNFLPFPNHETEGTIEEKLYLLAVTNFKYIDTLYYKNCTRSSKTDNEPIFELKMEDLIVYATGYEYCNYNPAFGYQVILRNFKTGTFFILFYSESCLEGEQINNDYYAYPLHCDFSKISEFLEIFGAEVYNSKNRIYKIDQILEA